MNWTPGTDAPAMSHGAVILMAQTVGRRTAKREVWNRYNADDLMVIDEAHHAAAESWERAMKQWPGRILGMTATPWRLSKKEGFDHLFGALLCGPQVADLQSDNWLCDAQTLLPPPNSASSAARLTVLEITLSRALNGPIRTVECHDSGGAGVLAKACAGSANHRLRCFCGPCQ